LHYPVPVNIFAGTATGWQKMAGYPANRNRISGTALVVSAKVLKATQSTNCIQ